MDLETLCRRISSEVKTEVMSFVGTEDAGKVLYTGADGTATKFIDKVAEDAVFRVIEENSIPIMVVSEEAGVVNFGNDPEYIMVLDPIDGTHNAISGIPFYSISMAFARYNNDATLKDITYGFIENLATGEVFQAEKGKGAFRNGDSIMASHETQLDRGYFSIYINPQDLEQIAPLLQKLKKIRAMGCMSLEMCLVAKGNFFGVMDFRNNLRNIDIAAGYIILEEAGGFTTDLSGNSLSLSIMDIRKTNLVAASNKNINKKIIDSLEKN